MNSFEDDDNILEIDMNISDYLTDDENSKTEVEGNDAEKNQRIVLKFFRKGNLSMTDFQLDLLEYLVNECNLKVNGFYPKNTSVVLVEVELNDLARGFLISIHEERLGNKVRNVRSLDINKICDGKFQIVIRRCVILVAIFPDIEEVFAPCRTSFIPYGLSNGDIMNLIVGEFSIYDKTLLKPVSDLYGKSMDVKIIGMRWENSKYDKSKYSLRIAIMRQSISDKLLIMLNSLFGKVSFVSDTVHLIPTKIAEQFTADIKQMNVNDYLVFLMSNDMIHCVINELKICKKARSFEANVRRVEKRSIFDRLGGRIARTKKVSFADFKKVYVYNPVSGKVLKKKIQTLGN